MARDTVVVLAYHAVGVCSPSADPHNLFVTPDRFAQQMKWLSGRARVVPLAEALSTSTSGRLTVAITFDDAYRNLLTHALPVLERFSFHATVFVPTQFIGQKNEWDAPTSCDLAIMDENELAQWRDAGMDLQSHGHSHIDMRRTDTDEIKTDILASLEKLRTLGLQGANIFLAYPFSDGTPAADEIAQSLGIERAFSIEQPVRSDFVMPRVAITGRDSMAAFRLKTSGFYAQLRHSPAVYGAYRRASRLLRRAGQ